MNIKTGVETQLTDEATLDDGPEYSPDGKYIFFNSVRAGNMQLWRMDADGKKLPHEIEIPYLEAIHVSEDKKNSGKFLTMIL